MPIDAYLFTGIAGIKKRRTLNYFRKYLLTEYPPVVRNLTDKTNAQDRADAIIPIIELVRLTGPEVEGDFYDLYSTYEERIETFANRIKAVLSSKEIQCVFIHTHLTHLMTGHFRSWLGSADFSKLFLDLNLKKIIYLTDNVFSCHREVCKDGYPFSLDQLMTWRDVEQMTTEVLAGAVFPGQSQFECSKIVAINHTLKTLADILFDPTKLQLYLAFPISKIRMLERLANEFDDVALKDLDEKKVEALLASGPEFQKFSSLRQGLISEFPDHTLSRICEDLLKQNLEYRQYFTENFIAYDPSTIDEVPLLKKAPKAETVRLERADIWPSICEPAHRLGGPEAVLDASGQEFPAGQIEQLKTPVPRQVRSRDFRLIEQAQGLVAYRPTLGGRWSSGVQHEIEHVYRRLKRPFFVIKDVRDAPLSEGTTLGWKHGDRYWGEWDLSKQAQRVEAFKRAEEMLKANIADQHRV